MAKWLGPADANALAESLERPSVRGLRVHPGRTSVEEVARVTGWQLAPVPWSEHVAILDENVASPGLSPLHEAGAFYLQDPAATLPAIALDVRPGDWVADLAAAPGGKATALGAALGGKGLLLANDVGESRVPALGQNLERFGIPNVVITQIAIEVLASRLAGRFDAVLLDAPCSGEGMFRKSATARIDWSEDAVAMCATRQQNLIEYAATLLKPGGRLVYATCTFAPEENEAVVGSLLKAHSELSAVPLKLPGTRPGHPEWVGVGDRVPAASVARLWPHQHPGDGHTVAKLERSSDDTQDVELTRRTSKRAQAGPTKPSKGFLEAFDQFYEYTLTDASVASRDLHQLHQQGDLLWNIPDAELHQLLHGLAVLRPGLLLGEVRHGRFEPAHALARALTPTGVQRRLRLDANHLVALRWLTGEELEIGTPGSTWMGADEDGYALVTVNDFSLGWTRRSGARLRNLFPKGLRRS